MFMRCFHMDTSITQLYILSFALWPSLVEEATPLDNLETIDHSCLLTKVKCLANCHIFKYTSCVFWGRGARIDYLCI